MLEQGMKTLVVYDSVYGNTERIAKAIGEGLGGEAEVLRVGEVTPSSLGAYGLVVVGSPTHGGRPTPSIVEFINGAGLAFDGVKVAAFDTRMTSRLVGIFGNAAERIGDSLKGLGGSLVAPPEGFYIKGSKGPLKEGELERAAGWAREIGKSLQ